MTASHWHVQHDVLGLGDWSGELENETSPSETGLEYWRNYYKKMKLDLVSLVSPALPASLAACYFPDVESVFVLISKL